MRYEQARSRSRRKQTKLQQQLEELERREETLQSRKVTLRLVMDGFFTLPRETKTRKTNGDSFFAEYSDFLDSGWYFVFVDLVIPQTFPGLYGIDSWTNMGNESFKRNDFF